VLKSLAQAIDDGDHVWAIIKGSAVNNDGASKSDYTAPSVEPQAEAISEALGAAGVSPLTISYVEAHGTGTNLGDPIEVAALTRAFATNERQYCALGSIKGNFGHLDVAAGMASLVKVLKSFEHGKLPPSINFESPNPQIDFPATPFFVNTELRKWEPMGDQVRRAGINVLGMGGTNAHVILEEPPRPATSPDRAQPLRPHLFLVSARTETALDAATERLADYLEHHRDMDLADVAWTLQRGRRPFRHRRAIVASDVDAAVAALREQPPLRATTGSREGGPWGLAFAFPGVGSQHPGMGRELYEAEPAYRDAIDRGVAVIDRQLQTDLLATLFPPERDSNGDEQLIRPELMMPALYVSAYAQAQVLIERGLEPAAMIGQGLGEYVAATLSGVFSYEDALRVVARCSRLLGSTAEGAMLAASITEDAARQRLVDGASIGILNGPEAIVFSGSVDAIEQIEASLTADGVDSRRIRVTRGYHSQLAESITAELADVVASVPRSAPRIPFVSNLSGNWITDEQAVDPTYWASHAASTVRFGDGLAAVAQGRYAMLEVGVNQVLNALALQHPACREIPVVSAGRRPTDEVDELTTAELAIGKLWANGVDIDWDRVGEPGRRRVPLPTYPFEGKSYWFGSSDDTARAERRDPASFGWTVRWEPADGPDGERRTGTFIFVDAAGRGDDLVAALAAVDVDVVATTTEQLVNTVRDHAEEPGPLCVVDFGPDDAGDDAFGQFNRALALVKQLGRNDDLGPIEVTLVVRDLLTPSVTPASAVVLGPALVASKEFNHLSCRVIDGFSASATALAAELLEGTEPVVVIRDDDRFLRTVERSPLGIAEHGVAVGEVFVLTGGLGGIGLALAEHLVAAGAKVGLIGRRTVEEAGARSPLLDGPRDDVATAVADVTDLGQLQAALDELEARLGPIGTIVHTAGVVRDGLVAEKTEETAHEVLRPKVQGSLHLLQQCNARGIPVLVLCSSINSLLAPVGQVDYVAANSFMDHLAATSDGPTKVVSLAWPGWRDVGIVARMDDGPVRRAAMARGIDASEGVAVFAPALAAGPHIAIAPGDLAAEVAKASSISARQASTEAPSTEAEVATGETPTSVEASIVRMFGEILGESGVGRNDSFLDLGGTSLLGVKLITEIERTWGVTLTLDTLLAASSAAALADLVAPGANSEAAPAAEAAVRSGQHRPLLTMRPGQHRSLLAMRAGSGEPLFLVNGEGGNLVGLKPLLDTFGGNRPVWGFRSAGLDGGLADETIEGMAARYLSELSDVWPDGPKVIVGYCMGGVIAYEMARQLSSSRGIKPAVVMIDTWTPAFHHQHTAKPRPLAVARYYVAERAAKERAERDRLGRIYPRERLSHLFARLSYALSVPVDEEASITAATLDRVASTNTTAFFAYDAGPYDGRVLLIRPRRRPDDYGSDPTLGWSTIASDLTLVTLAEFRFQLWVEPWLSELSAIVDHELRLADERRAGADQAA
jgi:thioesterase domain-containing protein/malonyl CoA-acyl carrier protein transacylase